MTDVPVVRQTMLALAVIAFLGYALNDSGVAIPALMAVVFECAVVYVALVPEWKPVTEPPPSALPDDGDEVVYARSPELVCSESHAGRLKPVASSWRANRAFGSS